METDKKLLKPYMAHPKLQAHPSYMELLALQNSVYGKTGSNSIQCIAVLNSSRSTVFFDRKS